jgi:hypothetical protein
MSTESIKKFIKAKKLLLILAIIGVGFLLFNKIGSCVDKKQGATVEQISSQVIRRHVIDSMQGVLDRELITQNNLLIEKSEKQLKDQQQITTIYKKATEKWKHKTDSLLAVYKVNPTLANCDSVVNSQKNQITEQEGTIESLGEEAEEYSLQLHKLKQNITLLDSTVLRERNEIKALQINLSDTQILYEKLKERKKIGNAIRNTIIVTELVILLVKGSK